MWCTSIYRFTFSSIAPQSRTHLVVALYHPRAAMRAREGRKLFLACLLHLPSHVHVLHMKACRSTLFASCTCCRYYTYVYIYTHTYMYTYVCTHVCADTVDTVNTYKHLYMYFGLWPNVLEFPTALIIRESFLGLRSTFIILYHRRSHFYFFLLHLR